jgi:DNA-binding HxlR family transcriptional regulator
MKLSKPKLLTQYDTEAIEPRVGCVATAMEIIGNKWTALLLKDLASGPKRFGQLQTSVEGINPRTLSQRLDELERCQILTKTSYAEVPPRTEYSLTTKGFDLVPVLRQMAQWGEKYYQISGR